MQHYVCGFLFSPDRSRVLLIRKRRPAWQAGRLNGVGGKVEAGEALYHAMRREFREEAGLDLPESQWAHAITLTGPADRQYDGTTVASLTQANFSAPSGLQPGDEATINFTSADYMDKHVGTGKDVTANGVSVTVLSGGKPVYGYQVASGSTAKESSSM